MAHVLDEERYARAKALHTKLSSPLSLQRLCFGFFFKVAGARITAEWKKSGENLFDLLPNNLRIEMLNYLLSSAHYFEIGKDIQQLKNHFYELTHLLMTQTTVKLDYQKYNSSKYGRLMSVDDFREILTNVALTCPKLEHLAVQGHDYDEDFIGGIGAEDAKDAMSPRSGIQHLLQLQDLTHLQIAGLWYWKDDGLCKLFSHLKKLVYLEILLHTKVTVSGFKNIHQLKELEEFHFAVDNPDERSEFKGEDYEYFSNEYHEWIYEYCAENVRSLKLIGATTEACLAREIVHAFAPLRFISPSISGTSRLEYLHTRQHLPSADFPNLRHLYIRGPIDMDMNQFYLKISSFTLLTELNLDRVSFCVVVKMLEFVGKQLNVLYIKKNANNFDFFQILHLCPNLEKFHQQIMHINFNVDMPEAVRPSSYQALVTKHNVRLLKVFRAVLDEEELEGLFELILFAPLLEDLILSQISFSKFDCLSLHDVLEGQFLNLRSVLFLDMALGPSCSMDDFGLMVKCLVGSAPRLGQFQYSLRDEDVRFYERWKSEQSVADSFFKLIDPNYETQLWILNFHASSGLPDPVNR